MTPKVPKKDIPGRPDGSPIDCHTSKISKFVDHYQQPTTGKSFTILCLRSNRFHKHFPQTFLTTR